MSESKTLEKKGKVETKIKPESNEEKMETKIKLENNKEKVENNSREKIENKIKNVNDGEKKLYSNKRKAIACCILIGVVVILLISFTIFSIINSYNKNIAEGIKINGLDVSQMSIEEAKNKIEKSLNDQLNKNILLSYDQYEISVTPLQAGFTFDVDQAINEAYKVGRDGNLISNNFTILKTRISGKNIDLNINVNEEVFSKTIEEINGNLDNNVQQPSYYINENELIITAGKEGKSVNKDEIRQLIYNEVNTKEDNTVSIQIPVEINKPDEINIEKIYEEVHKEAEDAYITKDPFEIHPHVEGVDFEISIDEAKAMLQEEKDEYKIPLKITKPSVTTDSLGEEAFPNRLATYSTTYSTANTNRSTNIRISANKINGVVLLPGEEFSYNQTLGQRTAAAGYKPAPAYVSGKVVNEYGGGICQTSSTLYNTVLLANLQVTSRTNHCYVASYVPVGRDATVSWGTLDFKFKNNRKNPIKIKAYTSGSGVVTVEIYGTKEDSDCEVSIESYSTGSIPYQTEYKDDSTLEEGKEVVEQAGVNGVRSEAYKILKKDGKVISKTLISRDSYSSKTKIVRRGTKKVEQKQQEDNNKNTENKMQNGVQENTEKNNNSQNNNQSQNNSAKNNQEDNAEQDDKKQENEDQTSQKTNNVTQNNKKTNT